MIVMKFGGASVNSAASVKNAVEIISSHRDVNQLTVVSAMGKTTNALEVLLNAAMTDKESCPAILQVIKEYHFEIARGLFKNSHPVFAELEALFDAVHTRCQGSLTPYYDFEYDQMISYGELISSLILFQYLNECSFPAKLADARSMIITDNYYREARVDWEMTGRKISDELGFLKKGRNEIVVTQGFIASDGKYATTLGREGSDYSAAVFAYALDAKEMIIWKDVAGLLNADPKFFPEAVKLDEISYGEAIELAYYGATIIHPKTIKPLQNKGIPLRVKSFVRPGDAGSLISGSLTNADNVPSYIFKKDQVLLSISPKDFSFIAEGNLHQIFGIIADLHIKVNTMQNSAISFSICFDKNRDKLEQLLVALKKDYQLRYNEDLELITIRHYNQSLIERVVNDRQILLEQRSRATIQLVVK